MGLLVFVRNLLLALCLFLVLGFLYYSAWKLHLLQWEDSSKYGHPSLRLHHVAAAPVGRRRRGPPLLWLLGAENVDASPSPSPSNLHAVANLSFLCEPSEHVLFFTSNLGLDPHF